MFTRGMKRIIRYQNKEIEKHLSELIDLDADYVKNDGATIHGKLLKFTTEELVILNARLNKIKIPLSDVFEVVIDKVSDNA